MTSLVIIETGYAPFYVRGRRPQESLLIHREAL